MMHAKVTGIPDLKAALAGVLVQMRRNVLRASLAKAGRVIRDEARRRAPILRPGRRVKFRTPGLLRKSIVVRTSKLARKRGDVGVFVNVRPAKAGQRGAKSPADPFYWRFVEFGTQVFRPGTGLQFLQRAARLLPQALQVFIDDVGPQVQKLNNRLAKRQASKGAP
jgi:HK97 gp10 family phage protein